MMMEVILKNLKVGLNNILSYSFSNNSFLWTFIAEEWFLSAGDNNIHPQVVNPGIAQYTKINAENNNVEQAH